MPPSHELISIGVVLNAHGIKGELQIKPLTDLPEQFIELTSVYLEQHEMVQLVKVEDVRATGQKVIVRLEGINDRTAAEKLKGALIQRQRSQLPALATDEYFIFDLIGLKVKTLSGDFIGIINDVFQMPANDVYVVQYNDQEVLIPAIKSVVKEVHIDSGEIIINPIDGLFE